MYNIYLSFNQTFQLAHFFIELSHGRMVSKLATESIGTRTSWTVLALLASASVKRFRNCSRSIYYPMISLSSSLRQIRTCCAHFVPRAHLTHGLLQRYDIARWYQRIVQNICFLLMHFTPHVAFQSSHAL